MHVAAKGAAAASSTAAWAAGTAARSDWAPAASPPPGFARPLRRPPAHIKAPTFALSKGPLTAPHGLDKMEAEADRAEPRAEERPGGEAEDSDDEGARQGLLCAVPACVGAG